MVRETDAGRVVVWMNIEYIRHKHILVIILHI